MIPVSAILGLGLIIFFIGLFGVLFRKNLVIMLMSLELLLNGINILLAGFSLRLRSPRGSIFAIFVIIMAVLLSMGLRCWGYLLGAGAASLVWSGSLYIGETKGRDLGRVSNAALGLLNAIAGIAVAVLGIVGMVKLGSCGFPWGR